MHVLDNRPAGAWRALILACVLAVPAWRAHAADAGAAVPAGSLLAPLVRVEFAIYYGGDAPADPLPRLAALRATTPGAPRMVATLPDVATEPLLAARLDRGAKTDYAPPEPVMIQRFGYGLSQADAAALAHAHTALILDFAHPASRAMPALRAASVLVEQLARDTHGFIWDEATREVMSPDAWHERRLLGWTGDVPDVAHHIVVHAYDNGGSVRAISLGMGKFGLPDVVLQSFSGTLIKPMGWLLNLTVQAMVEGAAPARAGQLDIDPRALRNEKARGALQAQLKPGAQPARLAVATGLREEGDPANRLMAISASRYPGSDEALRLSALSHSLFDAQDDLKLVHHTDELRNASEAARARLPALRELFARGLLPNESIEVKAPFRTDEGGREWMWVQVERWKGDAIEGMLVNEPDRIAKLHSGQHVTASQAEVFDWLHRFPDGHSEGDTTDAIIERLDKERQR